MKISGRSAEAVAVLLSHGTRGLTPLTMDGMTATALQIAGSPTETAIRTESTALTGMGMIGTGTDHGMGAHRSTHLDPLQEFRKGMRSSTCSVLNTCSRCS